MGRERKHRRTGQARLRGQKQQLRPSCRLNKIPLKGEHNVENVLAAVCAARLAGVAPAAIGRAIEKFHAVEHRLDFVATVNDDDY